MSKLKDAIMADGRKQYLIADLAGINETKLSKIVMGRRTASKAERKALARVLKITEKVLFDDGKG